MQDSEIIDLACHVFSTITDDLNEELYSNLDGELSIRWRDDRCFSAWASVTSDVTQPPKHYIGLTYDTVILLYRDIEAYFSYVNSGVDNNHFDIVFKDFDYPKSLAEKSTKDHCCKNMFISGITWILYHELGHLLQEHGHIRLQYDCSLGTDVVDCAASDKVDTGILSGKAAAVSHVTEMAADYFAVVSCLRALLHHFEGDELDAELRGFASALALLIYRFHGVNSYVPTEIPVGSHPTPLIRLEQTMPLIFEIYSNLDLVGNEKSKLSRLDLINLTSWSSFTVGFFWLRKNRASELPTDFFLSGSLHRPGMTKYHRIILDTWDEIKPMIDNVKRIDDPYSELQFSDQYRNLLITSSG